MARPTKEGLEYFPLDTDIDQDEKVIVVIAKFGMRGFGILIRLMMEIYKKGYCFHWTEKEQYIFSMKVNEDSNFVNEVIQECIKWEFFHEGMYKKYGILTSEGFQKRYSLAVSRRKDIVIPVEHYLLGVNDDKKEVIDDINPKDDDKKPTKEKKEKESKRKKDMSVYEEIISYLNEKAGKNFSYKSEANRKLINGRMNEGRTITHFKYVIDVKCEEWLNDPEMEDYLRPSTLFSQTNFEKYVNQKMKAKKEKRVDPRDREIEFNQWVAEGNDPDAFNWRK